MKKFKRAYIPAIMQMLEAKGTFEQRCNWNRGAKEYQRTVAKEYCFITVGTFRRKVVYEDEYYLEEGTKRLVFSITGCEFPFRKGMNGYDTNWFMVQCCHGLLVAP